MRLVTTKVLAYSAPADGGIEIMTPDPKTGSWSFYTADRMGWFLWSLRKRLKFCRRWSRQHGGRKFRMYSAPLKIVFSTPHREFEEVWFHKREDFEPKNKI